VSEFRLPDLGEGLTDAEVVTWHVGPGDHVVTDQPLVAVETDKAVVEIPSPWSGHIARLCVAEGDLLHVGDPLVEFTDSEVPDVGAIVGDIEPAAAATPTPTGAPHPPATPSSAGARATPAVRARARSLGVDLTAVAGTGPHGAILTADVEAAAAAAAGIEPLRGARRSMASNMAKAHAAVVPATVHDRADVGSWDDPEPVMGRLVRAVAHACAVEPALNMSFHGPEAGRSANDSVDLGIAMDTVDGLFVPVLRNADRRPAAELADELDTLKEQVVSRAVPPDRLRGQTITLSNFGTLGGVHAELVVVPPQVAIVGAGRLHDAVVALDGEPAVRRVLPLSLTFDHRVVTGGEAARFLMAMIADLELPQ
jgi:pyruvate dehydrogenase E2 component (dihydrolipoamide acetyltransferase)